MSKIDNSIFISLKNEIKIKEKICKFIVFGSYNNNIFSSDIDILIVVDDSVDIFIFSELISSIVCRYIDEYGVFFSCFPVHFSSYERQGSQFMKNVRRYGKEI